MDIKEKLVEAQYATARAAGWTILTGMVMVGSAKVAIEEAYDAISKKLSPAPKRRKTYIKL